MDMSQKDRLPASSVLISIFGFWLFYALIVTLRASVMDFPLQDELAMRRIFVIVAGMLITVGVWQALRLADTRPLTQRIVLAAIVCLPAAHLIAVTNYYVFNVYDQASLLDVTEMRAQAGAKPTFWVEIIEVSISRYFFLIAWSALYLALSFAHTVRMAERRAATFERAAQLSELRALRYQLNPHFLFNTLNSLSALVMAGRRDEAESMILNLATFYRSSLTSDPSGDVPLADEIAVQRLYLDIEAVRFPDRLSVKIDVPPELENAAVPGLILQPLVENAIKHGVARSTQTVAISLTAKAESGQLILSVGDNAPTRARGESGTGIGQANVKDRLMARYGSRASVEASPQAQGGYVAKLSFPLEAYD
jgi:two-component system, LytTR family, sensor kinase